MGELVLAPQSPIPVLLSLDSTPHAHHSSQLLEAMAKSIYGQKNKTTLLPKPLDVQALWFLFSVFIKSHMPLLPWLFQSVVNSARNFQLQPGAAGEGLPVPGPVAGGVGPLSEAALVQPRWPRPGLCLSFLPAWKREVSFTTQTPQQKQCAFMNLWKNTHFPQLRWSCGIFLVPWDSLYFFK